MKDYTKPIIKIVAFRQDESIAVDSIYDYSDDNAVPVILYGINESSWNSAVS